MTKYIVKSPTGTLGGRYHTNPRCPMIIGCNVVPATDSLLRYYGITEPCRSCETHSRDRDLKKFSASPNKKATIVSGLGTIINKGVDRKQLRNLCTEYSIPFSLRSTKPNLSKAIALYWINNGMGEQIDEVLESAKKHWAGRIEAKDRHKPQEYERMLDLVNRTEVALKGGGKNG